MAIWTQPHKVTSQTGSDLKYGLREFPTPLGAWSCRFWLPCNDRRDRKSIALAFFFLHSFLSLPLETSFEYLRDNPGNESLSDQTLAGPNTQMLTPGT